MMPGPQWRRNPPTECFDQFCQAVSGLARDGRPSEPRVAPLSTVVKAVARANRRTPEHGGMLGQWSHPDSGCMSKEQNRPHPPAPHAAESAQQQALA
jgi:hypothetical protein